MENKAKCYKCCELDFFIRMVGVVVLVLFAGLMSGLTLGLMSMSLFDLEVLAKSGSPRDSLHAAKILPVVKRQHLLLCTLLLSNAVAMEALPIFLRKLVPDLVAILFSVTLILLFGEIIPQSVCTRYGLVIGAAMAPVVRLLVWIFYPVAYPISKLLDFLLGKGHKNLLRRVELKTLVDLHGAEAGKGGELSQHETTIISGALELTEKTARDSMTPLSKMFAIDINTKLNMDVINMIMEKGHSRVPVYHEQPDNIIGFIMVKNLLTINPADELPATNVTIRRIPRVSEAMPLYDILREFQKGISHMAAVIQNCHHRNISSDQTGLMGEVSITIHNGGSSQTRSRRSQRSLKNSPGSSTISSRVNSRSRRWSSDLYSDILHINENSISTLTGQGEVVGIITMEDIIEELLKEEIYDETDHLDNHS